MSTNGKMLVNAIYQSAVISGIAIGFAKVVKMGFGGAVPRLDYTPRDFGLVITNITLAIAAKETLIKQGIIPPNILK